MSGATRRRTSRPTSHWAEGPVAPGPAPLTGSPARRYRRLVPTNEHSFPTRSARPLIAAIAVVALAATACSEDASDSATPSTTPSSVASTVAPSDGTGEPSVDDTVVATTAEPGLYDIVGTALHGVVFTQLAGMLVDADLIPVLRGGPFTVFAPTNEAFRELPLDALHEVQDDPELLATVLTYHVVPGVLMAADLEEGPLETVAGIDLEVTRDGDSVFINGNEITVADVVATNGVIHVMSDVLLPPS